MVKLKKICGGGFDYTPGSVLRKWDVKKTNPRERLRKPVSQMKGVLRK